MPIPITCPECDTKFQADDDRAGKRTDCPECGERVPVPVAAARPMARPVVAARPVAPKPKVEEKEEELLEAVLLDDDDNEQEPPKAKGRRDADDEDVPLARRRREDDEEEEDDMANRGRKSAGGSARRRRPDADDAPKKKGGSGLMILGIVLGVLLLVCVGGGTAAYFFVIKPIGDAVKKKNDARQADLNEFAKNSSEGKLTAANVAKIQKGWTLAQCQQAFGQGMKADQSDTDQTLENLPTAAKVRPLWKARTQAGQVYNWDDGDTVCVAFDADPTTGGKVIGLVADIDGNGTNPIILGGFVPPPTDKPLPPMDAVSFVRQVGTLGGKQVSVSGEVKAASETQGTLDLITDGSKGLRLSFNPQKWKKNVCKPGDMVTVTGRVNGEQAGIVQVGDCELLSHSHGAGPDTPPPAKPLATLTADVLADEITIYNAQLIQVSGTAAVVTDTPGGGGSVDFKMTGKRKTVRAAFDAANWKAGAIKVGDTLSAKGTTGYGKDNIIVLSKCELVKHEAGTAPKADAEVLTVAQVIDGYDTLKGKVVTIQGKVAFREENANRARGVVAFDLVTGAKMSVRAVLEKGNWRTNFLADGDTLTVKGKVTNEPLVSDGQGGKIIVLEDCELVKRTTKDGKDVPIPAKADPKPTDAIEVTADDFVSEYVKDPAAAETKYKDKLVRITGEVKSTTPLSVVFVGQMDGEFTVSPAAILVAGDRPNIAGLKNGDKVTVVARVLTMTTRDVSKTKTIRLADGKIEK